VRKPEKTKSQCDCHGLIEDENGGSESGCPRSSELVKEIDRKKCDTQYRSVIDAALEVDIFVLLKKSVIKRRLLGELDIFSIWLDTNGKLLYTLYKKSGCETPYNAN
jgi:hypothetical protein